MKYLRLIRNILQTNLIKTLLINFRMLPFRQAVKLPIYVYGKCIFRNYSGSLLLDTAKVYSGMIKIGKRDYYIATSKPQSIWNVEGTLIFKGAVSFAHGSYLLVARHATLSFGTGGTYCGTNFKVLCFERITIGDNVRMAWDVQIMDSSFHYTQAINKGNKISPLTKPIVLEGNIWIGNRTTIAKGAIVPQETIIASNSLVNKDFSDLEPYSLIAGSPATLKATGIQRIWDEARQRELDAQFGYTRTHL